FSQSHDHDDHAGHDHGTEQHAGHDHGDHAHGGDGHGCEHKEEGTKKFNPGAVAFHHISDQNVFSIGPLQLPLPVISYVPGHGVDFFSSGKFDADYHGIGRNAYDGYVLYEGQIKRVVDQSFPKGLVELGDHMVHHEDAVDPETNKAITKYYVCYNNQKYYADSKSTLDFGLFGGGITSFHDLSLTKNVVSMFLMLLAMWFMFRAVTNAYKNREGQAPTGLQGFIEPIFVFIQDEVAKPFLGHKWEKFLPFLMAIFFFILSLNLFGQIPFFGNANVTGSLSVTLVLAVIAFLVTNLNGNGHYWQHVFNMPGVPAWVKVVVTPVEIMGLFIKPITLMLRLFGNITAGHMVIVIFVGLIFIFGQSGANTAAGWGTIIPSMLLTLFMMAIELLVAFIQAFVFCILTASYIGAAVEEHHH
ncbi:MAG: F0F1 ATP synthase subunit A, partial [Bacteroidota bacterium]